MFGISSLFETGVYPARVTKRLTELYGFEYFEYNIPLGALKSSLFGEYYIGADAVISRAIAIAMFALAVAVIFIAVATIFWVVIRIIKNRRDLRGFADKSGFSVTEFVYILIFTVTQLASYVVFCFRYPHFCTMDFRYIALTVVVGALLVGIFANTAKQKNTLPGKVLYYSASEVSLLFALTSAMLYGAMG